MNDRGAFYEAPWLPDLLCLRLQRRGFVWGTPPHRLRRERGDPAGEQDEHRLIRAGCWE